MEIDLADIKTPFTALKMPTISGATSQMTTFGVIKNNDRDDWYYLSAKPYRSQSDIFVADYPSSAFDYYHTSIWAGIGNKSFRYTTLGDFPAKFIEMTATADVVKKSLGDFLLKINGTADRFSFTSVAEIGDEYYYWDVEAPSSQLNIMLPEIGDIVGIKTLLHKNFTLETVFLTDRLNYSNNSGFFTYEPINKPYEETLVSVTFADSGKRKMPKADDASQKERLSESEFTEF